MRKWKAVRLLVGPSPTGRQNDPGKNDPGLNDPGNCSCGRKHGARSRECRQCGVVFCRACKRVEMRKLGPKRYVCQARHAAKPGCERWRCRLRASACVTCSAVGLHVGGSRSAHGLLFCAACHALAVARAQRPVPRLRTVSREQLHAIHHAVAIDNVSAVRDAMQLGMFAQLGWDQTPRASGGKFASRYYLYLPDVGFHGHGRVYTLFHHAVHKRADKVAAWALQMGADPFTPCCQRDVNQRSFRIFGLKLLVRERRLLRHRRLAAVLLSCRQDCPLGKADVLSIAAFAAA